MKLPEWNTVQRAPSTFRFPGGESFTEMQSRMVSAIDRLRAAHPGGVVVCVSHADPIKAAVAHAMGTHIDLFQRIVISPARSPPSPIGMAGPSCSPSTPPAARWPSCGRREATDGRVLRVRRGRRVHRRRGRPARPAHVLPAGPPRRHAGHGEVREAAGRGHRRVPAQGAAATCRRPPTSRCRRRWSWPSRSIRRSCSARSGWATTATTTACWCSSKRSSPVDDEGEPDPDAVEDRGHLRVFLTRGQAAAFCEHAERSSPPAVRRAGGAATRSTRTATRARG